jgi:hypothetical protein
MKMIKSTSRISISGTTFTSAIDPDFALPSKTPMSHLAEMSCPCEEDSHIPRR